jgi:hypothetical protein
MSGVIQVDSEDRLKEKWDFCSEECARERFNDMMSDAYKA